MTNAHSLLRLCQLVSPALPIGGYNFSQGLEYAVHANWVRDAETALSWISGLATHAIGTLDIPVLLRLHDAWTRDGLRTVARWNAFLIAARETAELRAEDKHLGRALLKVLADLKVSGAREWMQSAGSALAGVSDVQRASSARASQSAGNSAVAPAEALHDGMSFAAAFALAAVRWRISSEDAAHGYLWAWAENQVLAAVKTVPLGQTAGQRMLDALIQIIPRIVADAARISDADIGSSAPLHLIASAAHETQYTRLYHS